MRSVNKCKGYHKIFCVFKKFPSRIKTFKSTEWKKIHKSLTVRVLQMQSLYRTVVNKPSFRTWRNSNCKKSLRRAKPARDLLVKTSSENSSLLGSKLRGFENITVQTAMDVFAGIALWKLVTSYGISKMFCLLFESLFY